MDPAARFALIRARLKPVSRPSQLAQKPAGLHCSIHPEIAPKLRKQHGPPPSGGVWRDSGYGVSLHKTEQRKEWVREPDQAGIQHFAVKRQKRVSPLTRIAEQLPMKLPRLGLIPSRSQLTSVTIGKV